MPQALTTGGIVFPDQVANEIWKKTQDRSVLARLSRRRAQKFGNEKVMTLTGTPRAELVGEGADKSPSGITFGDKLVVPRKLQVTVRVTNEVQWADADYQLGVWDEIEDANATALSRALDLIGFHKINPLTGKPASSISEGIVDTDNVAYLSGEKYDEAVIAAAALVFAAGYTPDGVALDNMYAFQISQMRDALNHEMYPDMGFGQKLTNFKGLNAAVGTTVSGKPEIETASDVLGVVGLYDAFRWGVQREIRAELIEYGDPDGLGDLKRKNQVAVRSEIVYGIGIMDPSAFALVKSAAEEPEGEKEPPSGGGDNPPEEGGDNPPEEGDD